MKILIAEDEFLYRRIMQRILENFGQCDVAINGNEAIDAFEIALDEKNPYDLICLDVRMPGLDGMEALKKIRMIEDERGILMQERIKIIMTTVLSDSASIFGAFREGCEAYLVKPVTRQNLLKEMVSLSLIPPQA